MPHIKANWGVQRLRLMWDNSVRCYKIQAHGDWLLWQIWTYRKPKCPWYGYIFYISAIQSVIRRPTACVSPARVLEVQTLRLHPNPTESEPLGMEPRNLCSDKLTLEVILLLMKFWEASELFEHTIYLLSSFLLHLFSLCGLQVLIMFCSYSPLRFYWSWKCLLVFGNFMETSSR